MTIPIVVAAALLLAGTNHGWALPPLEHSVSGIIREINHESRTLTLAPGKGVQTLQFVWKDFTRFSQGRIRICRGALESGQPVRIYYRREVGQLVPSEVKLRGDTPTRCATGGCCARRI